MVTEYKPIAMICVLTTWQPWFHTVSYVAPAAKTDATAIYVHVSLNTN